jgi:hypothetical protein
LEAFAASKDNVVLTRIDIHSWDRPVVKQFHIEGIPYLQMYDGDGRKQLDGTQDTLKWLVSQGLKLQ